MPLCICWYRRETTASTSRGVLYTVWMSGLFGLVTRSDSSLQAVVSAAAASRTADSIRVVCRWCIQ